MVKDRTLRRRKSAPKKRYFHKGGQTDFKTILNKYEENLESKAELLHTIQNEGTVIYDAESSAKNELMRSSANTRITFLENYFQDVQSKYTNAQNNIQQCVVTYGQEYSHRFVLINVNLQNIINQINEKIDIARNINDMFQQKKVHLHLIENYMNMLNTINVNELNAKYNTFLSQVDSIIQTIKDEYPLKEKKKRDTTSALEGKMGEIAAAISMVNRPIPDGFVPNNATFIQGCPLGTVLENDQCVYYNDLSGRKLQIEFVPHQKELLNTPSSEYIVWFNKINQAAVGNPTVFKRKEVQYIVPLSPEDAKLFGAKYVVSEQNGVPVQEYIFIQNVICCWDQLNTLLTQSTTETINSYYIDYDNIPQPVKIIDHVAPMIRKEEAFTKYVRIVDEVDQILTGIQYVETDASGNVLLVQEETKAPGQVKASPQPAETKAPAPAETKAPVPAPVQAPAQSPAEHFASNIIASLPSLSSMFGGATSVLPFYPDLYEYKLEDTTFTKKSYNGIDRFIYVILQKTLEPINSIRPITADLDVTSMNPYKYSMIPIFYVNKYVTINVSKFYSPFILPHILMNPGDYFLLHNISPHYPVIISISKDDKRVLLYPNEVCCFVYTHGSTMLQYGFLSFEKNSVYSIKTKKVTKIPTNKYIFVETKALYENGKYIMQTIEPILDSEKNLILVPNFNEEISSYYAIDDVYERVPIKVEIVQPSQVTVDNKSYDSTITATNISNEYLPYKSDFAVITTFGNVFLFSDSEGKPLIDSLGYVIPVPSPVFYDGKTIFWYAMETKKPINIVGTYADTTTFDDSVNVANQLTSPYSALYTNVNVYTDANSIPILGAKDTLIEVTDNTGIISLSTAVVLPTVSIKKFNIIEKQNEITKYLLANKINIYIQTTDLLINKYKDISGNMNNLEQLYGELNVEATKATSVDTSLKIYNKILSTGEKLEHFLKEKQLMQLSQIKIDDVKTTRNNELLQINAIMQSLEPSFQQVKTSIDKLNDIVLSSDYNTLYNTYVRAQKSYSALNNTINTINDADILKNQENNVKLLLNSVQILQNNLGSLNITIKKRNDDIQSSLIDVKKSKLQGIIDSIQNEKSRIKVYKEERNTLKPSDDLNLQFTTAVGAIQTIFDTVDSDIKNDVMETPDSIDAKITRYTSYIKSIQGGEDTLESIVTTMKNAANNASQTAIVNAKNKLYSTIEEYETNHAAIQTLLKSLSINKEQYTIDLRENALEVTTMKGRIESTNDIVALEADAERLKELQKLDDTIQSELQTIELTTHRPLSPSPSLPLIIGGRKKQTTRKKKLMKK